MKTSQRLSSEEVSELLTRAPQVRNSQISSSAQGRLRPPHHSSSEELLEPPKRGDLRAPQAKRSQSPSSEEISEPLKRGDLRDPQASSEELSEPLK